jgi:hypothetical protein
MSLLKQPDNELKIIEKVLKNKTKNKKVYKKPELVYVI